MADNAYSNPQRVTDNSLRAYQKMSQSSALSMRSTIESMQRAVVNKRKAQQQLYNREQAIVANKEKTLNSLTSTGTDAFDVNMRGFWNDKIDQYYKIKNGMNLGKIDKRKGQAALTKLNQQLQLWKASQMDILALARQLKDTNNKYEAGTANGISSVTNQGIQQVLMDLADGGNVTMTSDSNGDMYLVSVDENGKIKDMGEDLGQAAINVKNLIQMQQQKNALITVPDTKKYDNKIVDGFLRPDNMQSPYVDFTYESTNTKQDPEQLNRDVYRSIDDTKIAALKTNMYDANAYSENVKDDNYMTPLWQDIYSKMLDPKDLSVNNEAVKDIIASKLPSVNASDGYDDAEKKFLLDQIQLLANTKWGEVPSSYSNKPKVWKEMQQQAAQVLMIDKSVNNRIDQLNLKERKYVKTEQKPKQGTAYTRDKYELRKNDISLIIKAGEAVKDQNSFLAALNNAAKKELYIIKNGEIYDKRGNTKLIYDLKNDRDIINHIGNAAGISTDVMTYALLPQNSK